MLWCYYSIQNRFVNREAADYDKKTAPESSEAVHLN